MDQVEKGLIIPPSKLSPQVLQSLIEEFVLREGTDYGMFEVGLETKKKQILQQLKSNKILILFNPVLETTTLITVEEFKRLNPKKFEILDPQQEI